MIKGPRSYVEMLDEVVKERAAKAEHGTPLRPSNAGSCARRIAYEYAGYLGLIPREQEERKPSVERLLKLGHYIEEQLVADFKDIPGFNIRYMQQEVDIFDLPLGSSIAGSTDIAIFNDETAGVADVKSIGDRWDAAFSSKWDKLLETYRPISTEFAENSFYVEDLASFLYAIGPDDSLYKNLIQLNLYACSPFLQKRGVDHASIIRYNKNNSKLMEIRFEPSPLVFDHTKARFEEIEAVAQHEDPSRVPKERVLGSMDCTYCPYNQKCWPKVTKKELYQNMPEKKWAVKVEDLKNSDEVIQLLSAFELGDAYGAEADRATVKLILMLENLGLDKIKHGKAVYEVKHLKSGSVLRRGKE